MYTCITSFVHTCTFCSKISRKPDDESRDTRITRAHRPQAPWFAQWAASQLPSKRKGYRSRAATLSRLRFAIPRGKFQREGNFSVSLPPLLLVVGRQRPATGSRVSIIITGLTEQFMRNLLLVTQLLIDARPICFINSQRKKRSAQLIDDCRFQTYPRKQ